ncbi:alkylation response protein AidB-like acyl-CoA dehydrogenase [Bradyrhizobium diazoefficiens]
MPIYKAPVEDVNFLLNDVFQIDRYDNLPGFSDASSDVREAILGEAAKLAEEVLQPLNRVGDLEGCKRADDGSVTTPKGFKDAFKQVAEGGWLGLSAPTEFGGQGLPVTLSQAVNEFQISANMAFSMYGGLTMGATAALIVHGSPEQKKTYVPKMVAGEWTGTMNLTEPHCGTDLGMLRTKAVRQPDGSFKITGTKIFISAGEHDLADNIIHLVLARIEGAPSGIKGVSLFVVPKFLVNADGSVGARNGVVCGSIEHKMGIHGNSTCVMNYDSATGWLIGEENKGMQGMFVMMNEARLGVAVQGLAQSEVAYQNAVAYARERIQGPFADRHQGAGQAGRSDHRASRRAPHAAVDPRLQRGRARLRDVDRAEERRCSPVGGCQGPSGRRRPYGPDDAGAEGLPHRLRLRQRCPGAADVWRPRLHRRAGHGAVRARCAYCDDL